MGWGGLFFGSQVTYGVEEIWGMFGGLERSYLTWLIKFSYPNSGDPLVDKLKRCLSCAFVLVEYNVISVNSAGLLFVA